MISKSAMGSTEYLLPPNLGLSIYASVFVLGMLTYFSSKTGSVSNRPCVWALATTDFPLYGDLLFAANTF